VQCMTNTPNFIVNQLTHYPKHQTMDKSALTRATDPSSAPTPGYLYNDIGKSLTTPQSCVETLNFLLSRLNKNNPHVKRKCLKVLAKIAAHSASRGMMKRAVVQNPAAIGAIKEGMAWRGSVDAVTGDQYNVEVREAAKECLEVVYSDQGDHHQGQHGGGGGMGGAMMVEDSCREVACRDWVVEDLEVVVEEVDMEVPWAVRLALAFPPAAAVMVVVEAARHLACRALAIQCSPIRAWPKPPITASWANWGAWRPMWEGPCWR